MWSSASFISIENLTNSTWKFVIKPNDNFKYAPGQFIQIKIKDIVRSYSIASYNLSENIFELLIVKLEGGIMTKILFEEINNNIPTIDRLIKKKNSLLNIFKSFK